MWTGSKPLSRRRLYSAANPFKHSCCWTAGVKFSTSIVPQLQHCRINAGVWNADGVEIKLASRAAQVICKCECFPGRHTKPWRVVTTSSRRMSRVWSGQLARVKVQCTHSLDDWPDNYHSPKAGLIRHVSARPHITVTDCSEVSEGKTQKTTWTGVTCPWRGLQRDAITQKCHHSESTIKQQSSPGGAWKTTSFGWDSNRGFSHDQVRRHWSAGYLEPANCKTSQLRIKQRPSGFEATVTFPDCPQKHVWTSTTVRDQ